MPAGAVVAVLAGARGLAPVAARMIGVLPGWLPVAATGTLLVWAGATYEARLRNLRAIRRSLAAMGVISQLKLVERHVSR